jgi:probable HAF family extracellular repeat protein
VGTAAVLQQITTSGTVSSGPATFELKFMSQPDGQGDEVARAAGAVTINGDGTGLGDITTVQKVARVAVVPGQEVLEGESERLSASAYDQEGKYVAVTADSIFWSVASNPGHLTFEDGLAVGGSRGTANVVATIDHIASPAVAVWVSFAPKVTEIEPVSGGEDGITFVNALTPDGRVAVGTTRSTSQINGFVWSKATGTVAIPNPAGAVSGSAFGVSTDGTVVVGTSEMGDGSTVAWKWTSGGLPEVLPTPAGFVRAGAKAVSGDGRIAVGYVETSDGDQSSVYWRDGEAPVVFFDGTANAITRDGAQIVGNFMMDDGRTVAYKWSGPGYFTNYTTVNPDVYLSLGLAVSADGRVIVGAMPWDGEDTPMMFSPETGVVQINGSIGTDAYSVSADGKFIGGGAPEGGICFYWTPTLGLQNFGRLLGEKGLIDDFNGLGPGTINGVSDDKSVLAVTGYPGGGTEGAPHGFIVELPDFMDRP